TREPQPRSSACEARYMTAIVSSHEPGIVTAQSPPRTIVGRIEGGDRIGCSSPGVADQCSRNAAIASITTADLSIALTAPPWRQLGGRTSACPARPGTVITPSSEPRQPIQTQKLVGSVTNPASARSPCATSAEPPAPEDSSSVLVATIRSPANRTSSCASTSAANAIAATPPFMSQAPRPYSRPSRTSGINGGLVQAPIGSAETTSMWPLNTRRRAPPAPGGGAVSRRRPGEGRPAG